jgi:hypothetical protein
VLAHLGRRQRDRSQVETIRTVLITMLRTGVSIAEVEDGLVLLDERAGRYWRLNATGALILKHLLAGDTATDVACRLRQEWDIPLSDAQRDVLDLLGELRQNGLVR